MATPIVTSTVTTGVPTGASAEQNITSYDVTRITYEYIGTITSAVVRWWIRTSAGWSVALDTSQDVALDPVNTPIVEGTTRREIRDYTFGAPTIIFPQIITLAGGGTLNIYVDGASAEV